MSTKVTIGIICGIFATFWDMFFMYYLYKISLCIPLQDQENKQSSKGSSLNSSNEICFDKYIRLLYPSYFFRPKQTQNMQLQQLSNEAQENINQSTMDYQRQDEEEKDDELFMDDSNNKDDILSDLEEFKITPTRCSCATHCVPMIMFGFCLSLWNIICGLLFMVLQTTFMINMIFQFLVACFRENTALFLFGGVISLYMGYVLLWLLGHSYNATLLLWNNVSHEFNTNIQYWWNLGQIFIWFMYVFIFVLHDTANFDEIFWPTMLEWLIIRGMIWIILFTMIAIIANASIVYHVAPDTNCKCTKNRFEKVSDDEMKSKIIEQKDDYKELNEDHLSLYHHKQKSLSFLNWNYFLFGITNNDAKQTYCSIQAMIVKKCLFCVFCMFVVSTMLFSWIHTESFGAFTFAWIMLVIYYIIVAVLDKVDSNALYWIWSGRYHRQFWKHLRKYWNKYSAPPQYVSPHHQQQIETKILQSNPINSNNAYHLQTQTLSYFDLWCQFVDKYQYFCGFRCKYTTKRGSKRNKKCRCSPWIVSSVKIIVVLFASVAPFSFYYWNVTQRTNETDVYSGTPINWMDINNSSPYPMCESLNVNGVDLLDLVYLSYAIYYPQDLNNSLKTWFNDTWNISFVLPIDHQYQASYAHITKHDTDLILVRGTLTANDIIQDLSLWSEISILQLVSWVIPITTITSIDFIRGYVYYASYPEGIVEPTLKTTYYSSVYEYINKNLSDSIVNDEKTIVILGHSLGGGVAQIVAAKLLKLENANNVLSFGLASPGTLYSSKKFGFTKNSLYQTSISVLPDRDIVSQIDQHGGEIQHIQCKGDNALDCHSGITHFCEIAKTCGKLEIFEPKYVNEKEFIECACGTNTHNAQTANQCWDNIAKK